MSPPPSPPHHTHKTKGQGQMHHSNLNPQLDTARLLIDGCFGFRSQVSYGHVAPVCPVGHQIFFGELHMASELGHKCIKPGAGSRTTVWRAKGHQRALLSLRTSAPPPPLQQRRSGTQPRAARCGLQLAVYGVTELGHHWGMACPSRDSFRIPAGA